MNNIIIGMGICLGIVLLFGIYKLATHSFSERSVLKSGTEVTNRRQTLKIILTILFTILLFVGLYFGWEYFAPAS